MTRNKIFVRFVRLVYGKFMICLRIIMGHVTMASLIVTSYYEYFTCSYFTNRYVYFKYSYVLFTIWGKV